ncbi:GNAT family N-acetyltransferase, partial [Candidatus Auribacterota bacterium]
ANSFSQKYNPPGYEVIFDNESGWAHYGLRANLDLGTVNWLNGYFNLGTGMIEGNSDFSALGQSPYVSAGYENVINNKNYLGIFRTGVAGEYEMWRHGIGLSNIEDDEEDDDHYSRPEPEPEVSAAERDRYYTFIIPSVYWANAWKGNLTRRFSLGGGFNFTAGGKFMAADLEESPDELVPIKLGLATGLNYNIDPYNQLTLTLSGNALPAKKNIQDSSIEHYKLHPGLLKAKLALDHHRGKITLGSFLSFYNESPFDPIRFKPGLSFGWGGYSLSYALDYPLQELPQYQMFHRNPIIELTARANIGGMAMVEIGGHQEVDGDDSALNFSFTSYFGNTNPVKVSLRQSYSFSAKKKKFKTTLEDERKLREIRNAIREADSYEEFLHYINTEIKTSRDALLLAMKLNELLYEYIYSDDYKSSESLTNQTNESSQLEIYNNLHEALVNDNTEDYHTTVCRGIARFIVNHLRAAGYEAYAPRVSGSTPKSGHVPVLVYSSNQIYIIGDGTVIPTGTKIAADALQLYHKLEGNVLGHPPAIFVGGKMKYIKLPDTELQQKALTVETEDIGTTVENFMKNMLPLALPIGWVMWLKKIFSQLINKLFPRRKKRRENLERIKDRFLSVIRKHTSWLVSGEEKDKSQEISISPNEKIIVTSGGDRFHFIQRQEMISEWSKTYRYIWEVRVGSELIAYLHGIDNYVRTALFDVFGDGKTVFAVRVKDEWKDKYKGIGRTVMAFALESARDRGEKEFIVYPDHDSVSFYEDLGFKHAPSKFENKKGQWKFDLTTKAIPQKKDRNQISETRF